MTRNPKGIVLRLLLGVAMVLFVFPFITLSCGKSLTVQATGIQLVTGGRTPRVDSLIGEGEIKQEPLAVLAFAFGAAALLISFLGHQGFKLLGATCSAISATALALMKPKIENLIQASEKANTSALWANDPVTISFEYAYWLAVAAFCFATLIAIWRYFDDSPRIA